MATTEESGASVPLLEAFFEAICAWERVGKTRLVPFRHLGPRTGEPTSRRVSRGFYALVRAYFEWYYFKIEHGALVVAYKLRGADAPSSAVVANVVRDPEDFNQVLRAIEKIARDMYPLLADELRAEAWLNAMRWPEVQVSDLHDRAEAIAEASGRAFLAEEIREAFPREKASVADFVRRVDHKAHYARIVRAYLDV